MNKSNLFVGNDSGLMHLSVASNLQTIALFGPTNDKIYGHYNSNSFVIRTKESYEELFEFGYYSGFLEWCNYAGVDDKKYIIASLFGSKYFPDNFSKCAKEKDEMIKFVSSFLKNNNGDTYEYEYPDNNGTAFITDFHVSGGAIRIWCVDWSKKAEVELNFTDNLSLSVTTNKISQWIEEAL